MAQQVQVSRSVGLCVSPAAGDASKFKFKFKFNDDSDFTGRTVTGPSHLGCQSHWPCDTAAVTLALRRQSHCQCHCQWQCGGSASLRGSSGEFNWHFPATGSNSRATHCSASWHRDCATGSCTACQWLHWPGKLMFNLKKFKFNDSETLPPNASLSFKFPSPMSTSATAGGTNKLLV